MNIDVFLNKHENKDLLRFITCGSVDDGKSTLIGRLLYDSKFLYDDQLSKLREESVHSGNKGDEEFDYALLLDGLKAEREQGITIDVAYRYFSTPARKFIIADTPGHEQYTRNMATGASTADLAVILIDARKGVITQTRRHSFIVSLLGIKQVVVAVNKMDLVDYSEEVFSKIRRDFEEFSSELELENTYFIPLSALKGDNVVDPSDKMAWYKDKPLLERLETVDVLSGRNFTDFRYPVQYVNRPNLDFRGFSGTVASGVVSVGDSVTVLPSRKESVVKEIVTADGNLEKAFAGNAVTLVLADEVDISSGDMLVHSSNIPKVSPSFEAVTVWMSETPLKSGSSYLIRQAGRTLKARVDDIFYSVDVNTLEKSEVDQLTLNGIGRVRISTTKPIYFDPYSKNRETGGFIIIDPITNTTVAAGMILESISEEATEGDDNLSTHVEKREFFWETGHISEKARTARQGHTGKTVLLTGPVGTGKRAAAAALEKYLFDKGLNTYYLGIANVFSGLDADVGRGFFDRDEHIRRLGELSRIMTDAGLIFISAFDGVDSYDLDRVRQLNSPKELVVVAFGSSKERVDAQLFIDESTSPEEAAKAIAAYLVKDEVIIDYSI